MKAKVRILEDGWVPVTKGALDGMRYQMKVLVGPVRTGQVLVSSYVLEQRHYDHLEHARNTSVQIVEQNMGRMIVRALKELSA